MVFYWSTLYVIKTLDAKYSETVQIPRKRNLEGLSPTLATPTIKSI